jgi:hypothetical protein
MQKMQLDWWSSWGICETDDNMKELAKDMQLSKLQKVMVASVLKATKSRLDLKSISEWEP